VLKIFPPPLARQNRATYVATKRFDGGSFANRFQAKASIFPVSQEDIMKFRPLHDRVVVKRIDAEEKTKGGIIIPDTAKEKPSQGEILAVGPGGRDEAGKLIPIDLKVGDRVLFGKWSGTEVKIDGEDLLIMKESDIMGVIEEGVAKKKAA
jgi:chaperonin GroES